MARKIGLSKLNATTLDILNVIRKNATSEYQELVPEVTRVEDIRQVGNALYGYPALANQFINALVNRIALVQIKSATYNNDYAELKKGYLEFGETIEEAFVEIAKAREFSAEKAEAREFKRTIPDVRAAFHVMNWSVQYPITIQQEDLRKAFLSADGVQNLITKIIDSVYVAEQYDEFLLFKYLMIKAITSGKMYPISIGDGSDLHDAAIKFRGVSNGMGFMRKDYNAAHVTTNSRKEDQYIFMDSDFNAAYDVDVLSAAFNMDKAEFSGKLKLIDDWTSFDNDRFDVIRAASNMIEEVTEDELALMANVRAVLVDKEWFQVYDNLMIMSDTPVNSGLYHNYFLTVEKTVSSSPFSNAVVFVTDDASADLPDHVTVEVTGKDISEIATAITLELDPEAAALVGIEARYVQSAACTEAGIGVHKFGGILIPANADATKIQLMLGNVLYESTANIPDSSDVGDTFAFYKVEEVSSYLSQLKIGSLTLDPTFDPYKYEYEATTSDATNTITATGDDHADIVIKVNGSEITSGSAATWTTGENTVTVKVTGDTVKNYKVVVTAS